MQMSLMWISKEKPWCNEVNLDIIHKLISLWIIYILFFTPIPWAFLKHLKHLNVKIHSYISNKVYKLKNNKSLPFYFLVHSNPCLHRHLSSPLLSNNLYNKVFRGTNGPWICRAHEERIRWCILLRPLRHLVHNAQSSGVLSFCSPHAHFSLKSTRSRLGYISCMTWMRLILISIMIFYINTVESSKGVFCISSHNISETTILQLPLEFIYEPYSKTILQFTLDIIIY